MSKFIARRICIGFGPEAIRGTPVVPTFYVPQATIDFDEQVEYAKQQSAYCTIHPETDGAVIKRMAGGSIDGQVMSQSIGILIFALFGAVSSALNADASNAVYDHTFTVQNDNINKSLTISINDPVAAFRFPLGMINSLGINYDLGSLVQFTSSWMAKAGVSTTLTPAFETDESFFRPQDFELKLADDVAGLGAAEETKVRSFSINFEKGVVEDLVLGDVEPHDFNNTEHAVTGEVTQVFKNEILKELALNGTKKAMQIDMINTGVTIGTAANPELKITLNQVQFDNYSREKPLGDLVLVTTPFTAQYKLAEAKAAQVLLTNLEEVYDV